MPGENLVIVESPAKASTINKYLGSDFKVLASFGHVRDLPAKDGSVRPEDDFAMEWELGDRARRLVDEIVRAAKHAKRVYLATDPDREGEAISWHVQEVLQSRKDLKDLDFLRVTFNEITKTAVLDAIAHPRQVNRELVEAYLARRALDYLVGFTLSPVLWRKLPGSRSAGRVQSVALRLICEREDEIEQFRAREFWSIELLFRTRDGAEFTARLTHLEGRKLDKFDLPDEASALAAAAKLETASFQVTLVEPKQVKRHPSPPFTTSTLQQEASRKLGFGATQTMRVAQRLYEGVQIDGEQTGLITYMRTDGLQLAQEAIGQARAEIARRFGERYVPSAPRVYKSKIKNAQEAHEAIRPTELKRRPEDLARFLGRDELRLYELIWKRTMACQMESAVLDQVAVDITADGGVAVLRATGSIVRFDGFLKVYEEGRDEPGEGDGEGSGDRRLPPVAVGDPLDRRETRPAQHFTQPPPRYTEASLVKRLEELGIGRPSTYASILQVLQDRDYVRLEKKRFHPEDRGRLVTAFLASFFSRYVQYDFTAKLEDQLDEVSDGKMDWKALLRAFWDAFSAAVDDTRDLTITQVIDALDEDLGPHFFPPREDGGNPRACPSCDGGRLGLKLARTGAFIGCSNYPDCRFTRPLGVVDEASMAAEAQYPRALGLDPETGKPVSVRKGPFGLYVQREAVEEDAKPARVSVPKTHDPMELDLATALALLALPRTIGDHPDGGTVAAGIGRYGAYLRYSGRYVTLPADEDVLSIGMNRAVELLASAKTRPAAEPLRELGAHPDDGTTLGIFKGRYGPYVKHGKIMASLPKGTEVEALTMEQALELIAAKAAKGGKKPAAKKTAASKATATKTATAKKPAAKKAASKKAPAKTATAGTTAKADPAKKPAAKKPATKKAAVKSKDA